MAEPSNHKSQTDKTFRDLTQTPPWLYAAFNFMYRYDLDAAALPESAHHERYYTPENDALKIDWSEDLKHIEKPKVWLNPPFSDIFPWREKCLEQQLKGVHTTMFVPHENRAQWWPAGLPVKVIDITGYYKTKIYKSGKNKGQQYQDWCSGGIRFVDAKTGLENEHELNKPMCLIDFNPQYIGQATDFGFIQKNVLLELGHAELEKIKNSKVA